MWCGACRNCLQLNVARFTTLIVAYSENVRNFTAVIHWLLPLYLQNLYAILHCCIIMKHNLFPRTLDGFVEPTKNTLASNFRLRRIQPQIYTLQRSRLQTIGSGHPDFKIEQTITNESLTDIVQNAAGFVTNQSKNRPTPQSKPMKYISQVSCWSAIKCSTFARHPANGDLNYVFTISVMLICAPSTNIAHICHENSNWFAFFVWLHL